MRPALTSLVGNQSLKAKLLSDISSGTLSHAYIIEGKKGSGKHTIAYLVAAALSCENSKDGNSALPCLKCPSCRKILEKKSPDVICITREDKATLSVEKIRTLRNDVRLLPNELEHKIYILEDTDTMTDQAQNAFLLTLEEPPSYVKFFLLCEKSENLLETIKSRSQRLRTEPIAIQAIDEYLQLNNDDAKRLKLSDPDGYNELLMASEGTIGTALDLLEEKNLKQALEIRVLARDFINIIALPNNSESVMGILSRFDKKRENVMLQLLAIETALRDLIAVQRAESAPLLFFHNRSEAFTLSDSVSINKLIKIYDSLKKTQDAIQQNSNVRLSLTSFFVEINIL